MSARLFADVIGKVTVSGNTHGNPYHSEANGEFASADGDAPAEPPPGYTRLYRGDAAPIDQFDLARTSVNGLLGQGIYLTDSKRIAGDYRGKGASVFQYQGKRGTVTREAVTEAYLRQSARADFGDWPVKHVIASEVSVNLSSQVSH